ncbi:MAG: hypothetical protein JWP89_6921 [Schlesneria sp.]|nr:hypothetical protein [Schlesneria sp.]
METIHWLDERESETWRFLGDWDRQVTQIARERDSEADPNWDADITSPDPEQLGPLLVAYAKTFQGAEHIRVGRSGGQQDESKGKPRHPA